MVRSMTEIETVRSQLSYLATPYTKYPGGIEVAFEHATKLAARLLQAEFKVYSPIAHTHPIATYGQLDPLDHSIWLSFDEAMLSACASLLVAQLDGWRDSYGVAQEIKFFLRAGKPIYLLNPSNLDILRYDLDLDLCQS